MPDGKLKWSLSFIVVVVACGIIWLAVHYATKVQVRQYDFNGTVVSVHPETQRARVHNENMPGFMAPMDMDYEVENKQALSALKPGDAIHATLLSDSQGTWQLQNVTIKKH